MPNKVIASLYVPHSVIYLNFAVIFQLSDLSGGERFASFVAPDKGRGPAP